MIVVDRRLLLVVATLLLLAGVLAVPQARQAIGDTVARVAEPVTVADPSLITAQVQVAEREIERAYERGRDPLVKARGFKLPISDAQADAIVARYSEQLVQLRRSALGALADALALAGTERARYLADAEARVAGGAQGDDGGVLLAPSLGAIVARMNAQVGPISDAGVREMTVIASPSPGSPAGPQR